MLDADYVVQTNRYIVNTGLDIPLLPEIEGVPKLPELWRRRDALEAHLVGAGDAQSGDLKMTYEIVFKGESGTGVHGGYQSVYGHVDSEDGRNWIGVRSERLEVDSGADKLVWGSSLLMSLAERVFGVFGVGLTDLEQSTLPIRIATARLMADFEDEHGSV
jgi:hypothetical protein